MASSTIETPTGQHHLSHYSGTHHNHHPLPYLSLLLVPLLLALSLLLLLLQGTSAWRCFCREAAEAAEATAVLSCIELKTARCSMLSRFQ